MSEIGHGREDGEETRTLFGLRQGEQLFELVDEDQHIAFVEAAGIHQIADPRRILLETGVIGR